MLERPANFGLPASDLFYLGEQDLNNLKEKIASNKGKITLLVHPFYPILNMGYEITRDQIEDHKESVLEFMSTSIEPIFVLEEYDEIDYTRFLLSTYNYHNNEIYIIPTVTASPNPYNPRGESIKNRWDYLLKTFDFLKIREIKLGGRILDIKSGILEGCVGAAASAFKKANFKVSLSNLCFPPYPIVGY